MNYEFTRYKRKNFTFGYYKKKNKVNKKNNLFWGKCVFHEEKTPSFAVNDEKSFYHCFGCGAHGDVFSFLMHIDDLDFSTVLKNLCDMYNISYDKKLLKSHNNDKILDEILEKAMIFYENSLENNDEGINYLKFRGLDLKTIKFFHLGYSNQNKIVIELLKQYSLDQLKECGIISYGSFDRLRNRIIFPIFNERNKVVAFAGRSMENEKPKYINSAETPLFQKNLCLYNINNICLNNGKVDEIFLVEGYMDAISMHIHGFINVVASMGTSISKGQIFMLFRRTKKLFIVFDGDLAGQKAMERTLNLVLEMLLPGYEVYFGILPDNMDPDDFLKKYSSNEFRSLFKNMVEFLSDKISENLNLKLATDLSVSFNRLYQYIKIINNESVKISYKMILEKFLKDKQYSMVQKSKLEKKSLTMIKNYTPSIEENILAIILKYEQLFQDNVEHLARITFSKSIIEDIKNKMILYMNKPDNLKIIKDEALKTIYIQNIIESNKSFLHREEFCKKYLWDLLCLMKLNN